MKKLVRIVLLVAVLVASGFTQMEMLGNQTVNAATESFCDVSTSSPYYEPITQLAGLGIIRGYENGCFGVNDPTLRAQMAALVARAAAWDSEDWGNSFPDRGYIDTNLWRNVGTLAHYDVARGYSDGTYNPTEPVLYQQVILFISRAMIARKIWVLQSDDPGIYPNLPKSTAKEQADRREVATYVHYVGSLPGLPKYAPFTVWNQPATRGWFAAAQWQAISGSGVGVPPPSPASSQVVEITITPQKGPSGTQFIVIGIGFRPNTTYLLEVISFNGLQRINFNDATTTSDGSGVILAGFSFGSAVPGGNYFARISETDGQGITQTPFTLTGANGTKPAPNIVVTPYSAQAGETIFLTGTGFAPNSNYILQVQSANRQTTITFTRLASWENHTASRVVASGMITPRSLF